MDWKRAVLIAGRLGLGIMFLYSGYAKLSEPWLQFAVSIESFKIVPDTMLEPMARILPWVEVVTGLGVLLPVVGLLAAMGSTAMLMVFTSAGIIAYSKGLTVDCGCFGSGNADQIGPKWFAEHAAMVLLGVLVALGIYLEPRWKSQKQADAAESAALAVASDAVTS